MDFSLLFPYILLFLLFIILLENIASIEREKIKKLCIMFISMILIIWLDFYSFLLLTFYSSFIIFGIKYHLKIFDNILYFVIINIILLIAIKDYYLFFDITHIYIPLGVSYYFFRLIAFVIEYSKNKTHYQNIRLIDFYTYVYFFPIFLAGPIHRFKDFYTIERSQDIIQRIQLYLHLFGSIALKLVLVDSFLFNIAYSHLLPIITNELSLSKLTYHLPLFGFIAFLHAYFDLMLYTEISKALATILGFSKQENFNKPLFATNISQFWQSWHISLSNWTRDYIFFPTLIKTKKVWFSTYASMMMIGIWHSISWNWIFWAFMHGSALNFYLYLRKTYYFNKIVSYKIGKWLFAILGNITTIFFVSMIFVVVSIHDNYLLINLFKTFYDIIVSNI